MTISQQLEIDSLKKKLKDLEDDKFLMPFVNQMLEHIGVGLANTPFENWPSMCRIAFDTAARLYPGSSIVYLNRINR